MKEYLDNYANYALVRNNDGYTALEYIIMNKTDGTTLILEDYDEGQRLLKEWLQLGIEVFDSLEQFREKYPALSAEERMARGRVFWWQVIDESEWPQDIKSYFENDPYWKRFCKENSL